MSVTTLFIFFFNDTATTEIYTLSLHDALPICRLAASTSANRVSVAGFVCGIFLPELAGVCWPLMNSCVGARSEEHTSELQSRQYLVCRLLLEKKKKQSRYCTHVTTHTYSITVQ